MTTITNIDRKLAERTLTQWQLPADTITETLDRAAVMGEAGLVHHGIAIRVEAGYGNARYTLHNEPLPSEPEPWFPGESDSAYGPLT